MKILIIAAHMDDCELMFGGIIHNLIHAGHDVEYLIVTDSSKWIQPSAVEIIDNNEIFLIRKKEQEQAAAVLKVEHVHFLKIPDGSLYAQANLGELLLEKIRKISPDYVFTHSDKEFHSDHIALVKIIKILCNSIDEPSKITNPFLPDKNFLSPYQRLLASQDLSDEVKAELVRRYGLYNPVVLQREVHVAVNILMSLRRNPELEGVKSFASSALSSI